MGAKGVSDKTREAKARHGVRTVLDEHLLIIDDRDIGSCQVLDLAVFHFPELFGDLGDEAYGWVG